jgi:hypothetical protein
MVKLVRPAFCAAALVLSAAAVDTTPAQFPASNPQRVERESQVTVNAGAPWQDAGVFVEAGQRVTLQAFGTWRDRAGSTDANGRPSQILNGRDNEVAMPGAPVMMLVGKIGADGVPFRIGGQLQFLSPRQGQLFLMANDRLAALDDNRGTITVRIVASRAIPTPSRGSQGDADRFETNIGAREVWQDSGLFIEAGQRLTIQASGTWRDRAGPVDVNGRPSQPLNGRRDEIALPGAPAMMLVGKIGDDGVPFRIGNQTDITAPRAGQLLMMANDRYAALDDNRGTAEVRILIPRPAPARPPRGTDRGADRGSDRGGDQVEATVNAKEPWQDAGVFLEAGQTVTISANGTWGDGAGMTDANGRASQVLFGRRTEIALPSAPVMLLVGKIGEDGVPFRVGTELRLTAPRAGQLFLMANDRFDTLFDNRGRMVVRIVMPRGGQSASAARRGNPDRQGNADQVRVTANASEPWQDTGLYIEAGQAITILASGSWGDPAGTTNAGGRSSQILNGRRNEIAMPGAPVMMLIGRIGPQGAPFRVGLRMEQVAPRGGNLFLMANDRFDMLYDNQGALRVTVLFQ